MLLLGLLSLMGLGLATVMLPSPEEDEAQIDALLKTAEDELEATSKDGTTDLLDNVQLTVDTEDTETTDDTDTAEEIAEIQEAYEELPEVYKLTTVKNHNGTIYNPSFAISEGPDSGEDADRDFVVNGSDLPHRIVTQYDTDTTFLVQTNENTSTLSIGLNANVEEPEPMLTSATKVKIDSDDNTFTEEVISQSFDRQINTTLWIRTGEVGTHVSEIDLTNPKSTLRINDYDPRARNFHLVFDEQEVVTEDATESQTTRTAYIIESDVNIDEIDPEEIDNVIARDGSSSSQTRLVAVINLGTDILKLEGDGTEDAPYVQTISNFMNDDAKIYFNKSWTSEGDHDDGDDTEVEGPTALVSAEEPETSTATTAVKTVTSSLKTVDLNEVPQVGYSNGVQGLYESFKAIRLHTNSQLSALKLRYW